MTYHKRTDFLVIIFIIVICIWSLTGCGGGGGGGGSVATDIGVGPELTTKNLTDLTINPNSVTVIANGNVDLTNITVTAHYADGSTEPVAYPELTISANSGTISAKNFIAPTTLGKSVLAFVYTSNSIGKTAELTVNVVKSQSISGVVQGGFRDSKYGAIHLLALSYPVTIKDDQGNIIGKTTSDSNQGGGFRLEVPESTRYTIIAKNDNIPITMEKTKTPTEAIQTIPANETGINGTAASIFFKPGDIWVYIYFDTSYGLTWSLSAMASY